MNRYKYNADKHKKLHLLFKDPNITHEAVWSYIDSLKGKDRVEALGVLGIKEGVNHVWSENQPASDRVKSILAQLKANGMNFDVDLSEEEMDEYQAAVANGEYSR